MQFIDFETLSADATRGVASDLAYGYQLIHIGESFPDTLLKAPEKPEDRAYLGLKSGAAFSIKDIQADLVMVAFLNVYCVPCLTQTPVYNHLFETIRADAASRDRVKIIAVGVGNTEAEVQYYREEHEIPFPVVADPNLALHGAIGAPRTPFSVLVRLEETTSEAVVATTYSGIRGEHDSLHQDMMALKSLDPAVLRERCPQAETIVTTVAPPLPQSNIEKMIKTAMKKARAADGEADGKADGDLTEFQKLAFEDHHVYTGLLLNRKGSNRLFAEVVGCPTICDICQDVHFFYIIDETGKVLDFVPLQVTKWGNEEWSEDDIRLMRERLIGRFVFTPFYFNPEVDAVSSATITSVVIFKGMSQGKELYELLKQEGFIS